MKRLTIVLLSSSLLITGLSGCASSVKRDPAPADKLIRTDQKFSTVKVGLADEARQKLADNPLFDAEGLRNAILRKLSSGGCMDSAAPRPVVDVIVTDIRTRSGFAAVMFGFMAGDDRIVGTVALADENAAQQDSFQISASYALGGLVGGQEGVRMGYLYEKFAELTAIELRCAGNSA